MIIRAIVWVFTLLMLLSCIKETELPDDSSDKYREDPKEEIITDATIGSGGGVLKNELITITIPEGAFRQNEELSLSELTDSSLFGENLISNRFRIDGFPESFEVPIVLKIFYSGTLSNETFAVIGREAMDLASGSVSEFYDFIPVQDSGGFVIAVLDGMDAADPGQSRKSSGGRETGKKWISVELVSHYSGLTVGKDHLYKIYLPANREDLYSSTIVDYLDYAHERINSAILTHNPLVQWAERYFFPYPVFIANLSEDYFCKFAWHSGSSDGRMHPKGILALNVNKLDNEDTDSDLMRMMIGRELLRACLFAFDPEYPTLRPLDQIPHHWLDQAYITWSETELVDEYSRANHIPTGFVGNEMAPFHGMHAGILHGLGSPLQNILNHGSGMSPFIESLRFSLANLSVFGIYGEISLGSHPVEAIQNALETMNTGEKGYDYREEWLAFLIEYLQANIPNFEVKAETFITSIDEGDVFSINNETDSIKTFSGIYPDLSAKLYQIKLNDPEFRQTGRLIISLTEETTVDEAEVKGLVFGVNNGNITLIEKEGDLEAMDFQEYQSLLVLMVNNRAISPYTGSSSIGLKIQATRKGVLPYNFCQLELSVLGDHLVERNPPIVEPYHGTYPLTNTWKFIGRCEENLFTGRLDQSYHPDNTHGTLKVTFNEDLNITSFNLTTYDHSLVADTLNWEIIGTSINKSYQSGSYLQHELGGSEVCHPLLGVYYYHESEHSQGGTVEYTVVEHSCNENSLLKFSFRAN